MDKKYLAEIRMRCEAAMPGPWEVKTNRHPETTGEAWGWIKGPSENWCWTDRRNRSRHDAEFVAASRSDIPALLDEVERLQSDCNKIATENATLKRALEMVCAELNLSDVEKVFAPDYFIQQAQGQEAKDEKV